MHCTILTTLEYGLCLNTVVQLMTTLFMCLEEDDLKQFTFSFGTSQCKIKTTLFTILSLTDSITFIHSKRFRLDKQIKPTFNKMLLSVVLGNTKLLIQENLSHYLTVVTLTESWYQYLAGHLIFMDRSSNSKPEEVVFLTFK